MLFLSCHYYSTNLPTLMQTLCMHHVHRIPHLTSWASSLYIYHNISSAFLGTSPSDIARPAADSPGESAASWRRIVGKEEVAGGAPRRARLVSLVVAAPHPVACRSRGAVVAGGLLVDDPGAASYIECFDISAS